MAPDNKALVRRYYDELWSAGDFTEIAAIVHSDYRGHDPVVDEDIEGPDGVRVEVLNVRGAFPDIRFVIEQQVAEAQIVATRWSASGTHQGMFLGVQPTGRQVVGSGMSMFRIQDSLLVEGWLQRDTIAFLRAIAPGDFGDLMNALATSATEGRA